MDNLRAHGREYADQRRATHDPGLSAEATEGAWQNLPLRDFLQVIWRRLWVILLTMVVLTVIAVGFSFTQTPLYEASIKILIKQQQGSGDPGNLGSNVQGLQQLTQTMASAVKSSHVADRVAQELDGQIDAGELLGDRLRVDQIGQTQFMQVSYMDPSPERARQVADTIGDVFSEDVSQVNPNATATVWDRAATPDKPISPKPLRNGLLALGLGLGLGVVLAFLLEYLDVSRRSPEKAEADAKTSDVGD